MLVLSRKSEESLIIAGDIVVTILGIEGDRVKIGIQAPRNVAIVRQEVLERAKPPATQAPEPRQVVPPVPETPRRKERIGTGPLSLTPSVT